MALGLVLTAIPNKSQQSHPIAPPWQVKATVLLMPSGSDRITTQPLQHLSSEKTVTDEGVKALLAVCVGGGRGVLAWCSSPNHFC